MPTREMVRRVARQKARPRRGAAFFGVETRTVTFPVTALVVNVWVALGADLTASRYSWNWLNISEDVRHDLGITIEEGRRSESSLVTASLCQLKLSNEGRKYNRRNPNGPYYGLLGGKVANTPIWIELDPGDGFRDVYFGYVNEWPLRWSDPSGADSYVTIQCSGVLRRLAQGEEVDTTLNRTILLDNPVAFWRMDDPDGSFRFASSLPDGSGLPLNERILPLNDGVHYGTLDAPPGGEGNAADFGGGTFVYTGTTDAPGLAAAPPWTAVFSIRRPEDGSADGVGVVTLYYLVNGAEETSGFGVSSAADSALEWNNFVVRGVQNGADWEIHWWRNATYKGILETGTGTLGNLYDAFMGIDSAYNADGLSIGYFAVYTGVTIDATVHSSALQSHADELAHIRFLRVCSELGIPAFCQAATSAACGPQEAVSPPEILRDLENTDGGVIFEREFGLEFQALSQRYNQPVTLNLDFDQDHIYGTPEPADDDQRFRNQWTITNSNTGNSRTYRDPGYSVMDGLHPDGDRINAGDDDQLYPHASWRTWRDSTDEERWPRLPINLAGTPDLIPAWLATPLGARVNAANPPDDVAPDTIDAIIEGRTQRFDSVSWVASMNTSPARPYQIGRAGDSNTRGSWAQTSGTALAVGIDDNDISFTVNVTGPLWTTTPAGELIIIGGEVMSLDSVSGGSSPQTFGVTRSANGVIKSHSAGASVRVYRPAVAAY